jgi:hypothetical protein
VGYWPFLQILEQKYSSPEAIQLDIVFSQINFEFAQIGRDALKKSCRP